MSEEKKQTKKGRFKKFLKWIVMSVVVLILLIAGGVYYAFNYLDWQGIVRNLVHEKGSEVVGTSVNIGKIDLSLTDGKGGVNSISVANPKGYSQDYIIKLGGVHVSVDVNSVKKLAEESLKGTGSKVKTVVINEIKVDRPEVTYELMSLKQNNVDDILANIKKNTASSAKEPAKVADKDATQYKVAIKKVVIADGNATVAANLLGASQSLSLNLPTVTIANLGTEKQGITIEDGIARIFQEILKTTTNVVAKADLSGLLSGVGNIAGAAIDGAGKAAGAAVDGAGKAAGAAVDGAGKAAGAAVDGAKGLVNGVGGLFK